MRRRKKNSGNGLIIIIIVIVIALVCGVYFLYNSNIDNKTTTKNTLKTEEKIKKEDKENTKTTTQNIEEQQKEEQKQEETKEYNFDTQNGEEVKVDANKAVSATGFSGASNYKFYLRGTTLYFRDVSISSNKEEIIAYNVKDLYLENKEVTAELYSDGQIVKENNYITYK